MDTLVTVLAGAVVFGGSAWVGYRLGLRYRRASRRRYWAANGVAAAIGIALGTVGASSGMTWLWTAALALMAGAFSGLKYGLGDSVGTLRRPDPGEQRDAGSARHDPAESPSVDDPGPREA